MMEKDCQQCLELLPWYVNGSLSAAQAQQVFVHIEQCPPCAAQLRFLSSVQQQVRVHEIPTPAPVWSRLQRRLDRQAPHARRDWARAGISTAALAAVVAVVAVLMPQPADQSQAYRLLTSSTAGQAAQHANLLRVLPIDRVDGADALQLFSSINADVIAGPTPRGIYTLSLRHDVADREAFIATLRNNSNIDFVEWVEQP